MLYINANDNMTIRTMLDFPFLEDVTSAGQVSPSEKEKNNIHGIS